MLGGSLMPSRPGPLVGLVAPARPWLGAQLVIIPCPRHQRLARLWVDPESPARILQLVGWGRRD